MIPIKQTQLQGKESRGNSMTACYASYFDLKLKEMPALQDMESSSVDEWVEAMGYETESTANDPFVRKEVEEEYYIAFGESSREDEDFYHFVIMHEGKLFHDPHPDGGGLKKINGYIYFEEIYDTLPEVEKEEEAKEEVKERPEEKKPSHIKIDEEYLTKRLGFDFTKQDPYTGRAIFKLLLERTPLAEVTITAQRLSSMLDHPDKDAWILIYNEVGKGNSRMSKKIYFQEQANKFVSFFKWMNNIQ